MMLKIKLIIPMIFRGQKQELFQLQLLKYQIQLLL